MDNQLLKILEKLDDEDWNLPSVVKVVMKPKNTVNNPPLKKTKF
jgi:hypothetical protein